MTPARRPLDEVIGELAEGLLSLKFVGLVRPTGIHFALPVEARFDGGQVIADVPRLHTRTDFDLPLGRLTLTLAEVAT